MKRFALAIVALSALSAPALAANCAKDYKAFWEKFDRARYAKMSAEQIADLSRTALRGYDACTAGDERFTAANFFKKLDTGKVREGLRHLQERRLRLRPAQRSNACRLDWRLLPWAPHLRCPRFYSLAAAADLDGPLRWRFHAP